MAIFDIIVLVILAIAAVGGFRKGIITQVCGIAGLLLGIFLAFRFSSKLSVWLNVGETFSWILSFIIIVLAVILVLYFTGWLVHKVVHGVGLGVIDRVGGAVLGILKWGLILSFFMGLLVRFSESTHIFEPEKITGSKTYPPLKKVADIVFPYIIDAKEKYIDPIDLDGGREKKDEPERGNDKLPRI